MEYTLVNYAARYHYPPPHHLTLLNYCFVSRKKHSSWPILCFVRHTLKAFAPYQHVHLPSNNSYFILVPLDLMLREWQSRRDARTWTLSCSPSTAWRCWTMTTTPRTLSSGTSGEARKSRLKQLFCPHQHPPDSVTSCSCGWQTGSLEPRRLMSYPDQYFLSALPLLTWPTGITTSVRWRTPARNKIFWCQILISLHWEHCWDWDTISQGGTLLIDFG